MNEQGRTRNQSLSTFCARHRASSAWLALLASGLLPGGCHSSTNSAVAEANPGEDDVALFDRLITLEAIIPNARRRALTEAHSPSTEQGRRAYAFSLRAQPGMTEGRHFDNILVIVAPAGTFTRSRERSAAVEGIGGPNGAINDASLRTFDELYDLRVSEAMLLPNTVELSDFDIASTVHDLARRYEAAKRSGGGGNRSPRSP